ncbi:MAG: substrate-binding domain-containing protein, partial [Actinomycetota bacterium]|nr:substrate-binding domain-containing protein [Actinomycetota bacterium]
VNSRNQVPRFGMTDEPPSPTEVNQINTGTDAVGDEDRIHVIPAAVGSVAPLVNFPDNCDVNLLQDANKTPELGAGTVRVRFTKAKFEAAWARDGGADNWTALFPELAADSDCNKPIIRVVRFDESGTSFTLKDYLDTINPSRGWLTTFATGTGGTRNWPNAVFGARVDCAGASGPGSEPDTTDQLTSGCGNGNGSLVSKLISTDGSIGYSDISTARTASPSLAITPGGGDNDTYWTQIPNGNGCANRRSCTDGQFTEPTAAANGFRTDGLRGSNCQSTTFTGIPESTLGDFSDASGVNAPSGYGICTLTYGLLFDDYKRAYALQGIDEERKARTVKDYWTDAVNGGQSVLFGQDYAPLPPGILALAQAGVNAVGFDKAGTGIGPGPGPGIGPGPGPGGGGTPLPIAPSNVFSVTRVVLLPKTGGARLSVRLPGAGTMVMKATAKVGTRQIKVGGLRLSVTKSGTYKLLLKPSRAAQRVLNKRARAARTGVGRLKTRVKLTYTPKGGTARSSTKAVTLKKRLARR